MSDVLKIGTDCSGIEAPIQALRKLNVPFQHVFSSEINKYCIQSIKANYEPEILFGDPDGPFKEGDITKRNIIDVPSVDVYVCGFPCQPFSDAGRRAGTSDVRGRVVESCLRLIEAKQPRLFVLENVRGLLWHNKGSTWEQLWAEIQSLQGYTVAWKVLNTRDYGLPQNRDRLFIVGVLGDDQPSWPKPTELPFTAESFIDWSDTRRHPLRSRVEEAGRMDMLPEGAAFIDLCFVMRTTYPSSSTIVPCVAAESRLWNVPLHRRANLTEILPMQGFPLHFKQVVSDTQLKRQIGNSMSVSVLCALFTSLGLTT